MKVAGEGFKKTAFELLDYAESLDPEEYLDVFIDIIDLYCEFNYFNKAIGICQKLATNDNLEDKTVILMRMGILFGKMGATAKEIETYQKVLELNPDNKKARFRLSEIYEGEGKFSEAVKILAGEENELSLPRPADRGQVRMNLDEEEEDRIYLSEEEEDKPDNSRLGKRIDNYGNNHDLLALADPLNLRIEDPGHPELHALKTQKVDNLIKDIKNENALNLKTRRRMVNIVELNEQFFVNVQNSIDEIMRKYDLDILLLQFKKCELELKSTENSDEADFKCIKKALRLEQRKMAFRESIYHLLLNESKGKLRSTFQGFETDDTQFKKELNYLFIFKRKKNSSQESSKIDSMFKESKNKSCVARKLSYKLVTKMKTIPDYIGFERFVDIIENSMKKMYSAKRFTALTQICDLLMKLSKVFEYYPKFQVAYHFYGFLANCKTENFEKAYIFFRVISKNLIADDFGEEFSFMDFGEVCTNKEEAEVECAKGKHSEDLKTEFRAKFNAYSQADINKACFCMMNHLFNEFYQQENSHRIFFQKFQKQYERIRGVNKYVNFICTNNYIMSGSYGSAKEWLLKNGDLSSNPLSNFLLGYISLIESTNRNNENKIDMIHSAFEYFEAYKSLSPSTKLPEVYYNMGRAFSHLSMSTAALKMFAKAKSTVEDRILQYKNLMESQAKTQGKEISKEKWANFEIDYKKRYYYYESSFNEIVWHYKLNNKPIGSSLINSMFINKV